MFTNNISYENAKYAADYLCRVENENKRQPDFMERLIVEKNNRKSQMWRLLVTILVSNYQIVLH